VGDSLFSLQTGLGLSLQISGAWMRRASPKRQRE